MKTHILTVFFIGFFAVLAAQDSIYIFQTDGNITAFATNKIDSITFYPSPITDPEEVVDIDGNTYKTVRIGSQLWMAENLKTTHYNDGTPINYVEDNHTWEWSYEPMYSYYQHDSLTYKDKFGAFYTRTVIDKVAFNGKNLCPTGWHVPNDADWYKLAYFLGDTSKAGGELKQEGTDEWNAPNYASNSSGFNAIATGTRDRGGSFNNKGKMAAFWTTNGSEEFGVGSRFWVMYNNSTEISKLEYDFVTHGFSVRCIKD